MTVYLASPGTQQQAEHAEGMPVLLSFAVYSKWMDRYQQTFRRIMIDSGAFSEFSSGKKIDIVAYADWAARWEGHADAVAGLDDISGDWKKSMANYEQFPGGFPTFHESDPPGMLRDLVAMSLERKQWLGLGLIPPRAGKEKWVRRACDQIPESVHVHGWACRAYTRVRRIDSVDSTNWWRDGMMIRQKLPWMTYGECLEIVIKRYQRETREIKDISEEMPLFDAILQD